MENGPPDSKRRDREDLSSWYRMTGLGVEFVVAVALFGAIGWYADRKFGTSPVLVLVGVGLGFAVGLWTVIRVAMKSFR